MKDTHYSSKLSRSRKAQQLMHIYWKIFWSKVVADKTHFEVTLTSETIQLFKNKPKAQKWFLTDTSFEQSSAQMTGWIETSKQVVELSSRNTLCGQKKRRIVQNFHYALCSHFVRWERCIITSLLRKKLIGISRTDTSGYWLMYLKPSDSNRVQHNFFSLAISWLRLLSTFIMLSIVHYPLGTMNLWTLH